MMPQKPSKVGQGDWSPTTVH